MTDTHTPLPEHRRKSDKLNVGRIVLGSPFLVGGLYLLVNEAKNTKEAHTTHLILFAVIAVIGAGIIDFDPVMASLGGVAKRATAFLPTRKE